MPEIQHSKRCWERWDLARELRFERGEMVHVRQHDDRFGDRTTHRIIVHVEVGQLGEVPKAFGDRAALPGRELFHVKQLRVKVVRAHAEPGAEVFVRSPAVSIRRVPGLASNFERRRAGRLPL